MHTHEVDQKNHHFTKKAHAHKNYHKSMAMKTEEHLFGGFIDRHANLILILTWLAIFFLGLAAIITTNAAM